MQISAVLFAVSGIGSMFPPNIVVLGVWRVVGGLAIGIASVIAPAYIAEVAPPAIRGRLGSFQQAAIVLGIFISQLVNYTVNQAAGGSPNDHIAGIQAWQWMLGIEAVPALLYGVFSFAIPESPRFLIATGQLERARGVLAEVEAPGTDLDARRTEPAWPAICRARFALGPNPPASGCCSLEIQAVHSALRGAELRRAPAGLGWTCARRRSRRAPSDKAEHRRPAMSTPGDCDREHHGPHRQP